MPRYDFLDSLDAATAESVASESSPASSRESTSPGELATTGEAVAEIVFDEGTERFHVLIDDRVARVTTTLEEAEGTLHALGFEPQADGDPSSPHSWARREQAISCREEVERRQ